MKSRNANLIPFYITGAVLLSALGLHLLSRSLASREPSAESEHQTGLMEQIEALTFDARAKLGAALNDRSLIATNIATLFFDDVAVEKVNDGSFSLAYAPAEQPEDARKLYPRLWPWPRFIHGQIVRELSAQGATGIGFDVLFPELAESREEESINDGELGSLSSDEFFAAQMGRAQRVVLGVQQEDTTPAQLFLTNASGLASIASHSDYAVLRRVKPFHEVRVWHKIIREHVKALDLNLRAGQIRGDKLVIPSRTAVDGETSDFEIPLNPNGTMKLTRDGEFDIVDDPNDNGPETEKPFELRRVWNLGIALAARSLNLDLDRAEILPNKIILRGQNGLSRTIPLDAAGFFFIDWSIRYRDIKENKTPIYHGHLGEVLFQDKGRVSGDTNLNNPFADRIVFIGSVASGNNMSDLGATPLEPQTPLVTKHLNVANSILTGRFVERTSLTTELLLIAVLGAISAFLTWRTRVLVGAISICLLSLAYVAFSTWMYLDYRYWIPMVMPLFGGLILPHFSLVTYRVVFEQKEQRRVRGIFSKIVAPDVVHELLSAERLSLGGARRNITVFFADIRGFTEFTDSTQQQAEEFASKSNFGENERRIYFDNIAAEQLATVNLYLATIADTIKAHHGTLDKYMGDCVMAFWGAPVSNQRHALCCVQAAIDCQRALYQLNVQRAAENERRKQQNTTAATAGKPPLPLLPLLSLGTGINTGEVTVGLMGSDATILNYTVFGREVNLASRLEGASGRGRILISEATYTDLKRDDPALAATCIAQAPITPKGFRQAISIYEVPWKLLPSPKPVENPSPAPAVVPQA
ncbi:MAG TPA: adenylate/guanylate cyclase domain-containing protein [Verrucomicrobiae bacterium]